VGILEKSGGLSVILDGEGDLTVDGGDAHRVFSVAAGVTVELRNLTVTEGSTDHLSSLSIGPGGGISNFGTLILTNCTVSNSRTGDYFEGDGGGIFNDGTLTVRNSTISRNCACPVYGRGGGIRNVGTLTLESSTVSENFGTIGGGISDRGTTIIINSTISGNSTFLGGTGIENLGPLTVANSTLSGRHPQNPGEAILNFGTANLTNTLIEGWCGGQLISHGGNVESPGDTCGFTDSTDQVGVTGAALALGPLANNGGPTETRRLLPDSIAIDAAVGCPPPGEDQRGVARPQGAVCDAGAFELEVVLGVAIDIKPGSDPNSINPFSRGVIPVAILTTEDFDALTVDADSVLFGRAEAEKRHKRAHVEDVDGDGDLDLLLHFRTQDTGIALGDTEACLIGQTYDGVPIEGCDSVRTVPPGGSVVSTTVSSAVSSTNCGLGAELALLLPPGMWLWRRRRRRV
jgi:hypothetical protein